MIIKKSKRYLIIRHTLKILLDHWWSNWFSNAVYSLSFKKDIGNSTVKCDCTYSKQSFKILYTNNKTWLLLQPIWNSKNSQITKFTVKNWYDNMTKILTDISDILARIRHGR